MTELWEILLPEDWPGRVACERVGSVYVPRDSTAFEVVSAARERFGRKALAYRRSGSEHWNMIKHERIY
jgi:hypothetical protein